MVTDQQGADMADLTELMSEHLEGLSPKMQEVMMLLMEGHTTGVVAARLGVSVPTAQNYTKRLFRIVGVHSRAELMHVMFCRVLDSVVQ